MFNKIQILKSIIMQHSGHDSLKGKLANEETTLLEMFQEKVKSSGDNEVFGTINEEGEIVYDTYKSIDEDSRKLASFLETITDPEEVVGIASSNRKEWLVAEYATYYSGCINSPVYITASSETLIHSINHVGMKTIIATARMAKYLIGKPEEEDLKGKRSTSKGLVNPNVEVEKIQENIIKKCENVENIILIDYDQNVIKFYEEYNQEANKKVKIRKLDEIYSQNQNPKLTRELPKSDSLATICFTSGTSGNPKGAKLTHKNFIYQLEGFNIESNEYGMIKIDENDRYFSYLPLAHVLERMCVNIAIYNGAKIVFLGGNKDLFRDYLKLTKPTFLASVPLVLEKLMEGINKELSKSSSFKRWIFESAMKFKTERQKYGKYTYWILDLIVFRPIKKRLGLENLKGCLCGGAAVDPNLIRYMQSILSVEILQGYGQTEGLGANLLCRSSMDDPNTVGKPFITTKVRLEETEYNENHKLLYISGPTIMEGYYNNEEANKKAFEDFGDGNKWLNTGDIVEMKDDKIYIISRESSVVKLINGEYFSLDAIEESFKRLNIEGVTDYCAVYRLRMDYPVLLVVNPKGSSDERSSIEKQIGESLKNLKNETKTGGKNFKFRKIIFLDKEFNEYDSNLLTASMKKKRNSIEKYFKDLIDEAYEN